MAWHKQVASEVMLLNLMELTGFTPALPGLFTLPLMSAHPLKTLVN